jgi:hypothetical protein
MESKSSKSPAKEVGVTRRFNRLTASALAALAILCVFAGVPASAQPGDIFGHGSGDILGLGSGDIGQSFGEDTWGLSSGDGTWIGASRRTKTYFGITNSPSDKKPFDNGQRKSR